MRNMLWFTAAVLIVAALVGLQFRSRPVAAAESLTPAQVEAFLAPQRAALEAMRRPVVRIELVPLPEDDLVVSKVGGRAWWPAGQAAPVGEDGKTLVLLAQVNFAELPALRGYPAQGLLQFFIAADDFYGANFDGQFGPETLAEQRNFRVVYWPDPSVPSQALPVVATDMTPHRPDRPRRMRFAKTEEPLSVSDYRFDRLFGGNLYAAIEAYAQQHGLSEDALYDAIAERYAAAGHKLGGYPFFTQEDPRRGGDWELLFQLDSDDEMMWGDVGVGGFFIAPADLARADFSRVLYNWDCH